MSYASEHPVHCARQPDLGCTASIPGSKFDAMKAQREGWFFPRDGNGLVAYCPEHVPEWVAGWRQKRTVKITHSRLPASAACGTCPWTERAENNGTGGQDLLTARSREHVTTTGHEVVMTMSREVRLAPGS